jgi:hypothetical protein
MSTPFPGSIATPFTPPFKVVRLYFIIATITFVFLNGLMLLRSGYISGFHFQPKLLSFAHIAVLGWATMIIMGAMTQLIPVILETSLFSVRMAKWGLWLYIIAVMTIAGHFWFFATKGGGMAMAAGMLFAAVLLFVINVGLTLRKVKSINITIAHIIAAIVYLSVVATMGFLLGFNLSIPFMKGNHLHYLSLHAALGFGGWFAMIIMGVSYKLLPMFTLSYTYKTWPGWAAFSFVNLGILGIIVEFLTNRPFYSTVFILIGLIMFSYQVILIMKGRMRKALDIGLRHALLSYVYIPVAAILGVVISLSNIAPDIRQRIILIYGFTVLFGCITLLIIGMMYKIVPFLVWFHKYSDKVGKEKVPLLKDMFSEKIGSIQFWLINIGVPGVMVGLYLENQIIVGIGLTIMFIASLLFGYNMFTVFTRK